MSLKNYHLLPALSIGMMTVNGAANAACPCQQQTMVPAEPCPIQQTVCLHAKLILVHADKQYVQHVG